MTSRATGRGGSGYRNGGNGVAGDYVGGAYSGGGGGGKIAAAMASGGNSFAPGKSSKGKAPPRQAATGDGLTKAQLDAHLQRLG